MNARAPVHITLTLRNRQRARPIRLPALRPFTRTLLEEFLGLRACALGIHLVDDPEMIRVNETFLRHQGTTDVITFDYGPAPGAEDLHGELFVCVPEAVRQARRFRTRWSDEIARYVVHGVLHLRGHDDRRAAARRRMKRLEDHLVRRLRSRYPGWRRARRRGSPAARSPRPRPV